MKRSVFIIPLLEPYRIIQEVILKPASTALVFFCAFNLFVVRSSDCVRKLTSASLYGTCICALNFLAVSVRQF